MRSQNKLLAPASLKPICWRLFPRGRRRISVSIRSVPERTLFEHKSLDGLATRFTGGWFLVEGDSQPCLHDIGIKPSHSCAAAGFNLVFQQFQEVLRNSLKQADLVAEIPLGQEKIFLSSPVNTTAALNGPTFVDDDAVLLCGDSPSQLIDKLQEATRIYLDAARKCGLTLNFNKGKQRRWCRGVEKDTGAFPCSDSRRSGHSPAQDHRPVAAPTPCLGVQTCGYVRLKCCLIPA